MRIIDRNGNEITTPDLSVGMLIEEEILAAHHDAVEAVPEKWHYEVSAQYANGGKDVVRIVDVPGVEAKEAWDEYETVMRYIPYTEEELSKIEQEKKAPKPLTLEERLVALEKTVSVPEYAAGTWYYRGDKVNFNGTVYSCIAPIGVVCVWSPQEYPIYWQGF